MLEACIVTGGAISRVVVEPGLRGIAKRGSKKDIVSERFNQKKLELQKSKRNTPNPKFNQDTLRTP